MTQEKNHSHLTGYLLLMGSVLLIACGLHLMRAAVRHTPPTTVVAIMSASAVMFWLVAGALGRKYSILPFSVRSVTLPSLGRLFRLRPSWSIALLVAATMDAVTVAMVMRIWGAGTVAFLSNLTLVYLIAFGMMRGERVSLAQLGISGLILAGALLFNYHSDGIDWAPVAIMAGACAAMAIKQLLIKSRAEREPLPQVMACGTLLIGFGATLAGILFGQWGIPTAQAIILSVLAGLSINAVGMACMYSGYARVGVAAGAPFNSLRPIVVLLIGLALGGPAPTTSELVGGGLIIIGSALLPRYRSSMAVAVKST